MSAKTKQPPAPITVPPIECKHKEEFLPSFGPLSPGEVRIKAGSTLQRVTLDKLGPHTWCRVPASYFHVRCGDNYAKNKKKDRSATFMFSCMGVDAFYTPTKVGNIVSKLQLPTIDPSKDYEDPAEIGETELQSPAIKKEKDSKADGKADGSAAAVGDEKAAAGYEKVPQWVVVNFQLPNYEPSNPLWGSQKEDGPGHSVVYYFSLRPWAREELKKTNTTMPSIKLLRRFFNAPLDGFDEVRRRCKAVPRLVNIHELSIGVAVRTLVTQYNGKPFLTGPRCHTFIPGDNYLEIDVDIHRYTYLARKAAFGLMDGMGKSVVDFALVIEAQSDDEMPEQVLGCCRMSKVDVTWCRSLDYWLKHAASQASQSQSAPTSTSASASSTPATAPAASGGGKSDSTTAAAERKEKDGPFSAPTTPAVSSASPSPFPTVTATAAGAGSTTSTPDTVSASASSATSGSVSSASTTDTSATTTTTAAPPAASNS